MPTAISTTQTYGADEGAKLLAFAERLRASAATKIGALDGPERDYLVWLRNALYSYVTGAGTQFGPDFIVKGAITCVLSFESTARNSTDAPACAKLFAGAAQLLVKALPLGAMSALDFARMHDAERRAKYEAGLVQCARCGRHRHQEQMTAGATGPLCGRCWGKEGEPL